MAAGGAGLGKEVRFFFKTTALLLDDVRRTTDVEDFFSGESKTAGMREMRATGRARLSAGLPA
jgi:hypothetical protein